MERGFLDDKYPGCRQNFFLLLQMLLRPAFSTFISNHLKVILWDRRITAALQKAGGFMLR